MFSEFNHTLLPDNSCSLASHLIFCSQKCAWQYPQVCITYMERAGAPFPNFPWFSATHLHCTGQGWPVPCSFSHCVFPSLFCWGNHVPHPAFPFGEELGEGVAEEEGGEGAWMNWGLPGHGRGFCLEGWNKSCVSLTGWRQRCRKHLRACLAHPREWCCSIGYWKQHPFFTNRGAFTVINTFLSCAS